MDVQAFEIGGCVRDEIMGQKPHDIDYTCVADSFDAMKEFILSHGMKIVVESPDFFTIRAVAKTPFQGRTGGLDFVWARKEGPYTDGRRPDWVEPGTLLDDQRRRDFTMNSIGKAADGSLVDPFGGQADIRTGVIRAVGSASDRLFEDALRGLRAMRFAVTKDFHIDKDIVAVLRSPEFIERLSTVSKERQREEVEKMFMADTIRSMKMFTRLPGSFSRAIFSDGLRLTATMKQG